MASQQLQNRESYCHTPAADCFAHFMQLIHHCCDDAAAGGHVAACDAVDHHHRGIVALLKVANAVVFLNDAAGSCYAKLDWPCESRRRPRSTSRGPKHHWYNCLPQFSCSKNSTRGCSWPSSGQAGHGVDFLRYVSQIVLVFIGTRNMFQSHKRLIKQACEHHVASIKRKPG